MLSPASASGVTSHRAAGLGFPAGCGDPCPRAQHLRDGPGLRDATARMEGRVAIENLADAAESMNVQMIRHRTEKLRCAVWVVVNAEVRESERAKQPGPHRSLVVRAIAIDGWTAIPAAILRIVRREAPQSMRSQKM